MLWYVAEKYVKVLQRDEEERSRGGDVKAAELKDKASAKTTVSKDSRKFAAKKEPTDFRHVNGDTTKTADEDSEAPDGRRRRSKRGAKVTGDDEDGDQADEKNEGKGRGRRKRKEKAEGEEEGENTEVEDDGEGRVNGEQGGSGELDQKHAHGEEKKAWAPVYLTRMELDGLPRVTERLRTWPPGKKAVPSTITDPEGLLNRLEVGAGEGRDGTGGGGGQGSREG